MERRMWGEGRSWWPMRRRWPKRNGWNEGKEKTVPLEERILDSERRERVGGGARGVEDGEVLESFVHSD